jgi:hypothetical protein
LAGADVAPEQEGQRRELIEIQSDRATEIRLAEASVNSIPESHFHEVKPRG